MTDGSVRQMVQSLDRERDALVTEMDTKAEEIAELRKTSERALGDAAECERQLAAKEETQLRLMARLRSVHAPPAPPPPADADPAPTPSSMRSVRTKVASVTAARGLRCWALRAWMSLAETSEDPAEAESARAAAAILARQLRDDLDADLGASFEARPGIAGLLWAMD